jgi:hypothetical protein
VHLPYRKHRQATQRERRRECLIYFVRHILLKSPDACNTFRPAYHWRFPSRHLRGTSLALHHQLVHAAKLERDWTLHLLLVAATNESWVIKRANRALSDEIINVASCSRPHSSNDNSRSRYHHHKRTIRSRSLVTAAVVLPYLSGEPLHKSRIHLNRCRIVDRLSSVRRNTVSVQFASQTTLQAMPAEEHVKSLIRNTIV